MASTGRAGQRRSGKATRTTGAAGADAAQPIRRGKATRTTGAAGADAAQPIRRGKATRTTGAAGADEAQPMRPRKATPTAGTAVVDAVTIRPMEQAETAADGSRVEVPVGGAAVAARRATHRDSVRVGLPLLGSVRLPREELAFLTGVAVLGVAGVVEWPVVVLLGVGHALVNRRHNRVLREFGEALQEI